MYFGHLTVLTGLEFLFQPVSTAVACLNTCRGGGEVGWGVYPNFMLIIYKCVIVRKPATVQINMEPVLKQSRLWGVSETPPVRWPFYNPHTQKSYKIDLTEFSTLSRTLWLSVIQLEANLILRGRQPLTFLLT